MRHFFPHLSCWVLNERCQGRHLFLQQKKNANTTTLTLPKALNAEIAAITCSGSIGCGSDSVGNTRSGGGGGGDCDGSSGGGVVLQVKVQALLLELLMQVQLEQVLETVMLVVL